VRDVRVHDVRHTVGTLLEAQGVHSRAVVLHAERPVTQTEAVPVERVRLDTETVTEQQQVSGEVRKERIETEGVEDENLDTERDTAQHREQ
jgi:hypothetical protein